MKGHVFISHSTTDAAAARSLVEELEKTGLRCWIAPRDVTPGSEYGAAIISAIEQASAIVLLLSPAANRSEFVRREIERAASKSKPILVLQFKRTLPARSLELFISGGQWIPFSPAQSRSAAQGVKVALSVGDKAHGGGPQPGLPFLGALLKPDVIQRFKARSRNSVFFRRHGLDEPPPSVALFEVDGPRRLYVEGRRLRPPGVIVGRGKNDDLVIRDASVSRRHALLSYNGEHVVISDLHSVNGAWLNGRRLSPMKPQSVRTSDELRLASSRWRIKLIRE